jgi:TOD1/MUCI70, glycosyltransferase-like domain
MKVLVYTAVFGNYDKPKIHAPQNIHIDYLSFHEENSVDLPSFLQNKHPRYKAKYYKLHPYILNDYERYDYVIWLDGSGTFLAPNSVEELIKYCNKGYAVFRHPDRNCIYEEWAFCKEFQKYKDQPLLDQVDAYRKEGYPRYNGLYACGVIIRDTRKDFTQLDNYWMKENLQWSYQDQLSFPYILWKYGISIDVIDLSLVENAYVKFQRGDWTR